MSTPTQLYSQLFNPNTVRNVAFYKSLFTAPVHADSLSSVLVTHSEAVFTSDTSSNTVVVLKELLVHGIVLLADAIRYDYDLENPYTASTIHNDLAKLGISSSASSLKQSVSLSNGVSSSVTSRRSSQAPPLQPLSMPIVELDDGGDDITELNGLTSDSSSAQLLKEFDDGDDITTLNGNVSSSNANGGVNSIVKSVSSNLDNRRQSAVSVGSIPMDSSTSLLAPDSVFADIEDELRAELISNILKILQIWFKSIHETNDKVKKTVNSLGKSIRVDMMTKIFYLPGSRDSLDESTLSNVLYKLKFFLDTSIEEIQVSESGLFTYLPAIKESVYLLGDIVETLFLSIVLHKETSNDYVVIKSLVYTFCKVDFSSTFDTLLSVTNVTKIVSQLENQVDKYEPPKVRLSAETLLKIYTIVGVLSNIPASLLPSTNVSLSSDITNLSHDTPNPYEHLIHTLKVFDSQKYSVEFCQRLVPLLAMQFNYCYNFRPDLLEEKVQSTSLFGWFTGSNSNDLYSSFDTIHNVTSLLSNSKLSLIGEEKDPYLIDLQNIYEKKTKENQIAVDLDILDIPEFLPIALLIYTYSTNSSFLLFFCKQNNSNVHKIEAINPQEDTEVELFEIWLCLLSYVFQYQYRSVNLQYGVRLSLQVLLKLTSRNALIKTEDSGTVSLLENVKQYQINEYKWKLSHQKLPFIPNNNGKLGFKSSLFYILDVAQNLIRFNLNKKLNVVNFKMALNLIYQVLTELHADMDIDIGKYPWYEFDSTIFSLLKFIKKQHLISSKYYLSLNQTELVSSMVEEILLIVNFLLERRFNEVIQVSDELNGARTAGAHAFMSISFDLIYNILLHYEIVNDLMVEHNFRKSKNFRNLDRCLTFFENEFHLTEESKVSDRYAKLDLFDHDFDSPVLIEKINSYTLNEEYPNGIEVHEEKKLMSTSESDKPAYTNRETFKYINRGYENTFIVEGDMLRVFHSIFALKA
ncbi:hypothetical protein G9P44_000803 [Scheffersomyces stipitis]|nr:hypothetical protein G9P44_000803 [Scheffersomyces stipitis]